MVVNVNVSRHSRLSRLWGLLFLGSASMLMAVSGYADYWDSTDDCEPQYAVFRCETGNCIGKEEVCDGMEDCLGGEDEHGCNRTCFPNEFRCSDGACINLLFKCNGRPDCLDSSDERRCADQTPAVCQDSETSCRNEMECVLLENVCDGERDCMDGSDEDDCASFTCKPGQFRCGNTTECVPSAWVCDSTVDCEDGSDEVCSEEVLSCEAFLCKDKSRCLETVAVCDGHADCKDGSDEANNCSETCQKLGCSHGCLPSGDGVVCVCPTGYALLAASNSECQDVDECKERPSGEEPVCSQVCRNTMGSFRCSCVTPYALQLDGRSCRVRGPAPLLLFSTTQQIRRYNLRKQFYDVVKEGLYSVEDLEVDARNRMVFWMDSTLRKVFATSLAGYSHSVVDVGLPSPSGISYNWHTQLLYVVDRFEGIIVACTMTDIYCAVVVGDLKDRQPEDIVVDPIAKHMYWTESADPVQIMRSNLDGHNREVFLSPHMAHPDHLLIDYPTLSLYWVDTQLGVIYRVPINRPQVDRINNVQVVISYDIKHPSALAIIEDQLIWSEKKMGGIMAANKFTGKDRHRILMHGSRVTGAAVLHPALQPSGGDNPCERAKCSKVCVESDNDWGFTCLCPPEMTLHSDGKMCMWSTSVPFLLIGSESQIFQVPFKIVGHLSIRKLVAQGLQQVNTMDTNPVTQEIFFTIQADDGRPLVCKSTSIWDKDFNYTVIEDQAEYLGEPRSLAVDWVANQIFWLNAERGTIEIFKVEGSSRSRGRLSFTGVQEMKSIAINVTEGLLFYSTWGSSPGIMKCLMNGTGCSVLVYQRIRQPDHLLTFDDRLYWSDAALGHISSILYNGTDRIKHVQSKFPQEFTVYSHLYFSDNMTDAIHLFDRELNIFVTEYSFPLTKINDMVMLVPRTEASELPCAVDNGGCSDICLSLPDQQRSCHCPLGKTLDEDQQTCSESEGEICPEDQVLCISSASCILKEDLCQEHITCQKLAVSVNCAGADDDYVEEVTESCPENECQHSCAFSSDGQPACFCDHGYSLAADGHSCVDVDECSIRNGNCSQLCRNTKGSYVCSCVSGYRLIGDGATCHSKERDRAVLMVSTVKGVFRVPMDGESEQPFVFSSGTPQAFDMFPHLSPNGRHSFSTLLLGGYELVWAHPATENSSFSTLRKIGPTSGQTTVNMTVTVIQVDGVTGNIYYVAHRGSLYQLTVCSCLLQDCRRVISGDDWVPASLVFHQHKRMMYWNDLASSMIHGAYMDGQKARHVVSNVASVAHGLTLDPIRGRFYWIEPQQVPFASTIQTAKLDGTDRYTLESFPQKLFLSIDIFEGFLFMTEKNSNKVQKVSSFSARPVLADVRRMQNVIEDVRVVHGAANVSNSCSSKLCPYLCVLSKSGARCLCPHNSKMNNSVSSCEDYDATVPERPADASGRTLAPHPNQSATTTAGLGQWVSNRPYGGGRNPDQRLCLDFCLNGGSCHLVKGIPVCRCAEGFSGRRCNLPMDDTSAATGNGDEVNISLADGQSSGLDAGGVAGIVTALLVIAVAAAVIATILCRKKHRFGSGAYHGVEFMRNDDEASLVVTGNGCSEEFLYCKWDLDGNLLDSSSSSGDSAMFSSSSSSPGPIFRPSSHSSSN